MASSSEERSLLTDLSEDCQRSIFDLLKTHEQLRCGAVCKEMAQRCDEALSKSVIILEGGSHVTDGFLRWLLRRIPRGTLKELVLNNCTLLTRAGVTRALRFGHSRDLETLSALRVGGASWSVDELHWLVDACPSLRVLHADCRAKGVDQLGLLACDQLALHPRKLVLHSARSDDADADETGASSGAAAGGEAIGAVNNADVADTPGSGEVDASTTSPLGAALRRCSGTLQELDARGNVLDASGVEHVSSLLSTENSALRRLMLPGASALTQSMAGFADALSASRLEQLQLGCTSINSLACSVLASALPVNRSLRRLELQHCPLLDAGGTALANALATNRALHSLRVPFTGVGDAACAALAEALRQGSCLQTLDLSGNQFTIAGVTDLASALGAAPQLSSLSISANSRVGAAGAVAIASALPESGLAELHMEGCAIGKSPCSRLADALAASKLAVLDLSSNEIGDQGAWELAWRLPDCPRLRTLRLAVNEIEEDGASELLSGLTSNLIMRSRQSPAPHEADAEPGMRLLDLRGNRIPERSHTFLALQALGSRANVAFQRSPYGY